MITSEFTTKGLDNVTSGRKFILSFDRVNQWFRRQVLIRLRHFVALSGCWLVAVLLVSVNLGRQVQATGLRNPGLQMPDVGQCWRPHIIDETFRLIKLAFLNAFWNAVSQNLINRPELRQTKEAWGFYITTISSVKILIGYLDYCWFTLQFKNSS